MLQQLRALTQATQPTPLRHLVGQIFTDLTRLLGYLDAADAANATGQDPQPLFSIIHGEALALSDFVEAQRSEGYVTPPLAEALESAAFAIRHELRRVFERELAPREEAEGEGRRARSGDAAEVLRNCFQQATVIVAHALDDRVSDVGLFGDIQVRREKSQRLCEDLSALLRLIRHTEQDFSPQALSLFVLRLHDFRQRSMRHLMQKDWAMVEGFAAQVPSLRSERAVKAFLHQFGSYLELLLNHVRMRAVLAA
ncbi:MAG TPA: hypothetical protein VG148_11515 [Pyrinomonadaceae bacterium]|nr:hypothetical protein [Pyrinomonadaceae bacterium]